jgi:hypothetical protein
MGRSDDQALHEGPKIVRAKNATYGKFCSGRAQSACRFAIHCAIVACAYLCSCLSDATSSMSYALSYALFRALATSVTDCGRDLKYGGRLMIALP